MRTTVLLLVLLLAGCVSEAPPWTLAEGSTLGEAQILWEWSTSSNGTLGVVLEVEGASVCHLETFWRGRSQAYEVVGHLGFLPDARASTGIAGTRIEDSGGQGDSIQTAFAPAARLTTAGQTTEVPINHWVEWATSLSSREVTIEATSRFFVAFVGLDASVPVEPNFRLQVPWTPDNHETAKWILQCEHPVSARVISRTSSIAAFDDWTFDGNGVSAMVRLRDGLRIAGAAASNRTLVVSNNLTLFVGFSPDPEKMAAFSVRGPGMNQQWISPPTSYVRLGDWQVFAQGGPGSYDLEWIEVGATPFMAFHVVAYDWP
jgi:hypothetical protein